MRIAVTGSTGMIGSALVRRAADDGHEVIAIVRSGSERASNIQISDNVTVIECDISEYENIRGKEKCDIFFHLAWNKTSGGGRDDARAQLGNIKYTLDAVSLAGSWGASAFVGAGSQAEYGPVHGRIDENTKEAPESGYGIAKYSAGKLSGLMCRQMGIRFCWGRIFSVYGERDADHTLIMSLINTLLDGKQPELTECGQIWDYLYSEDAARALILIGLHGIDGRTYRIASGDCRPLKEYVCGVRDAADPLGKLLFGAREYYPHQPMFLCTDINDLTKDTGFVPEYRFSEGIARTVSYVRSHKKGA